MYVARYAVAFTCVAFAGYIHNHSFGHTSRYFNFNYFFALGYARPVTGMAWVLDDRSFSVTRWAFGLRLHHAQHGSNGLGNDALTMTSGTSFRSATRFCSRSVAVGARYIFLNLKLFSDARCNFLQGESHFQSQIAAPELCMLP